VINQHRDNSQAIVEGGGNLKPNEIGWIIKPPLAIWQPALEPLRPNDYYCNLTSAQRLLDELGEVDAWRHIVNVLEHVLLPEVCGEVVIYAPTKGCAVCSSVRNEDLRHDVTPS
jgi:hypothetical protein